VAGQHRRVDMSCKCILPVEPLKVEDSFSGRDASSFSQALPVVVAVVVVAVAVDLVSLRPE